MTYKCLCCPCDILGDAEYWYHLVSHHKMEREIAKSFVTKRLLMKTIAVCPAPFVCRECSLPLTDLVESSRMPETHCEYEEYTRCVTRKETLRSLSSYQKKDGRAHPSFGMTPTFQNLSLLTS